MVVNQNNLSHSKPPSQPPLTNAVPLWTPLDGRWVSHFSLREFASPNGLCVVHPCLLDSLERVRDDLARLYGEEVLLFITSATRTEEDNQRLARRLGWTDQGGLVARNSRHLPRFGGIAVDLRARRRFGPAVPPHLLAEVCRARFDYVRDGYPDGHIHADNRLRALTWTPPQPPDGPQKGPAP